MRRVLILLSAAAVLALQACCGGQSHLVADESVIAASPCSDSIYLYTPAIVEGFDGRYVVAVDYGGPGTGALDDQPGRVVFRCKYSAIFRTAQVIEWILRPNSLQGGTGFPDTAPGLQHR